MPIMCSVVKLVHLVRFRLLSRPPREDPPKARFPAGGLPLRGQEFHLLKMAGLSRRTRKSTATRGRPPGTADRTLPQHPLACLGINGMRVYDAAERPNSE